MSTLHQLRTHQIPVEGCFGCRVGTVQVNNSAEVKDIDRRERTLTDDLRAYKSFRQSGIQPQHLHGAAHLEREARSTLEVEHPSLMRLPDEARQFAGEAAQVVQEIPSIISAHKGDS